MGDRLKAFLILTGQYNFLKSQENDFNSSKQLFSEGEIFNGEDPRRSYKGYNRGMGGS
jgi:hypothetical protein